MPSSKRSVFSRFKKGSLRTVLGVTRRLPGAAPERLLQKGLVNRYADNPAALLRLIWVAADVGDLPLAIMASNRVALLCAGKAAQEATFVKATKKTALLETTLRKQLMASGKVTPDMFWPEGRPLPISHNPQHKLALSPKNLQTRAAFLQDFWGWQIATLSPRHQDALCRAYAQMSAQLIKDGKYDYAILTLQPLLLQWPAYQTGQRLFLRILVERLLTGGANRFADIDDWWAYYHANTANFSDDTREQLWIQIECVAHELITQKRADDVEQLVMPAFQEWPDRSSALGLLAKVSELRADWRSCADRWQLLAAVCNPITTKSRTHVAQNAKEMARRTKHALNQLRLARIKLARELYDSGKRREFAELTNRIVETIPDQRVLKKEREIIDLVRLYVQDALAQDGVARKAPPAVGDKPLRIAICLDVLKISDVHTHARVIFAMCRNLMAVNPNIETHVIVTNERFAVTTPVVAASFSPVRDAVIAEGARAALPDFFGKRFFIHVFRNNGLEGLVDTCKGMIDIAPDVILYGGGHRGLFSNESRVVRHCLYDHFPTAFFYIQSNNQVDDKLDMIIARGPHAIEGDPGDAQVRIQPYPTIVEEGFVNEVPIDMDKHARKHIISAITGVRMDVRMKEVSRPEMSQILSILDKVPGAVWHLIGATDTKKVIDSNPLIKARVKAGQMVVHPVLPFSQFTALVGQSSLFFHMPGFTGGSGGATVARRGGIPIVTFEHSDVSGRQPAQTVFAEDNLAEAVDMAVRLLNDGDLWCQTVEAQFAHTNWIRETAAAGFYDCLSETMTRSRSRLDPKEITLGDNDAAQRTKLSVV